jgi:hypothetical protein
VSKIANLERKAQFILNELYLTNKVEAFHYLPNFDFDRLLRKYVDYLIENLVCPNCYNDLNVPDAMNSTIHCHFCKWDSEQLNWTR